MATISFTKAELKALFDEIGMVVESCDMCRDDGQPRPDDALIRSIYAKIGKATISKEETLEQWRGRQRKHLDKVLRGSKWDRLRDPDYRANK